MKRRSLWLVSATALLGAFAVLGCGDDDDGGDGGFDDLTDTATATGTGIDTATATATGGPTDPFTQTDMTMGDPDPTMNDPDPTFDDDTLN